MPVFRQASDAAAGDVKLEAITQPLYDNQDIASGAGTYSFFLNPAGRPRLFTNMESAGSLTWPKRFNIKAIRLVPNPAGSAVAVVAFHANGSFTLRVGEKDYFVAPNWLLTPGVGYELYLLTGAAAPAAPATGTVYAHNGRPEHRNIYILQHAIWLPSVQNFRAVVDMAATYTPAVTLSTWVMLEGELFREIQ